MSETNQTQPSLQERMAAIKANAGDNPVQTEATPKEVAAPVAEKLYHVFYSTLESCRMITKSGRNIAFVLGKYVTDVPEEIEYLQEEMRLGNSRITVVAGKEQMTADDLDPMKALKKQHIKEYLAEQAELAKNVAAGTLPESSSETQKLTPGSTADTAGLAEQ